MSSHARSSDALSPRGYLLVVGSGPRPEWEATLNQLAQWGPLVLVDESPPRWQRRYVARAQTARLLDPKSVLHAAQLLSITHPLAGVIHFHPAFARSAARVRHSFGLPGPSQTTVEATVRHCTSDLLSRAGVDNSGALHADTFDQALVAAHHVGFPLVCKPAAPRKRYGARVVTRPEDLAEAYTAAVAASCPATGVTVETLLEGIEATAYTFGSAAGIRLVAVSHATFDVQAEPSLIPAEVVVDAEDVCRPAIERMASRALAAVGHEQGPGQIRFRLTATGPRVISVATHLSDLMTCSLVHRVTGVDLIEASARYARGMSTNVESNPLGAAAVRYLQSPSTAAEPVGGSRSVNLTPYARLETYEDAQRLGPLRRAGHIVATGADFPQAVARMGGAVSQLRNSPEPMTAGASRASSAAEEPRRTG